MRGHASVIARAGRPEAAMARRRRPRRPRYDLSAFTDDELEAMATLAERIEATDRIPAWTPAEQDVLARLEPKLTTGVRRTA